MNRALAACAALASAVLLVTGCSSGSGDAATETSAAADAAASQDAEGSADSQAPAESEAAVESEEAAPADVGDPANAACALLTDEEAQGFLEFEMTEAPTAGSLPQQGTSDCTWSAATGWTSARSRPVCTAPSGSIRP